MSAESELEICNLALSWLAGNLITSFDDDVKEAAVCKANYELARDAVLEDRAWTFATKRYYWTPLVDSPPFGYSHAFLINPEVIRILEVRESGSQVRANGASNLDWRREGNTIVCNAASIYVKAIWRITDTTKFTPAFVHCLAARLAADIAITLTESRNMQRDMWDLYMKKLDDAAATDGMQGSNDIIESRYLIKVR